MRDFWHLPATAAVLLALGACAAQPDLPLGTQGSSVQFDSLVEERCRFRITSGTSYDPVLLLVRSSLEDEAELELRAAVGQLPREVLLGLGDEAPRAAPIEYGTASVQEYYYCVSIDPVTLTPIGGECVRYLSVTDPTTGTITLEDALVAALIRDYGTDGGRLHIDAPGLSASYAIPAEAVDYLTDPPGTCLKMRARASGD